MQPRQPFGVVVQHRVAQRVALPSHDPGRVYPARPPKGFAIASAHNAARRSVSPHAVRHSSAAPMSFRITKPRAPIVPSCAEQTGGRPHFSPQQKSHQNQNLSQWVSCVSQRHFGRDPGQPLSSPGPISVVSPNFGSTLARVERPVFGLVSGTSHAAPDPRSPLGWRRHPPA